MSNSRQRIRFRAQGTDNKTVTYFLQEASTLKAEETCLPKRRYRYVFKAITRGGCDMCVCVSVCVCVII